MAWKGRLACYYSSKGLQKASLQSLIDQWETLLGPLQECDYLKAWGEYWLEGGIFLYVILVQYITASSSLE